MRGAGVMRGYFKDAVGSAIALEDHWLRTGDRGWIDADGFLYVTGRLKEAMVTAAGETIHPEEIEPYYASPLFAEHCVVPSMATTATTSRRWSSFRRRPRADAAISAAVAALRKAAPPRFRIASFVRISTPLPRTAIGKLRRRALADDLRSMERVFRPARRVEGSSAHESSNRTQVRALIADVAKRDVAALGADDDLVEHLGVDSLLGLQILAAVEKRLDVRLPDEELIHLRTIGRIAATVERARMSCESV